MIHAREHRPRTENADLVGHEYKYQPGDLLQVGDGRPFLILSTCNFYSEPCYEVLVGDSIIPVYSLEIDNEALKL